MFKRRKRTNIFKIFIRLCLIVFLCVLGYYYISSTGNDNTEVAEAKKSTPKKTLSISEMESLIFPDLGLTAQSVFMADPTISKLIYSKNGNKKMYPASTTKILTAITALDYLDLKDEIKVGDEANKISFDSSRAGLDYNEKLSVNQLLYALLVPSGNDAAYVFAVNGARKSEENQSMDVDTAVDRFITLMNEKAKKLGAISSNFATVDGYHDENHYTTARDLAVIASEAYKNPTIRQIVKTDQMKVKDWKQYSKNDPDFRLWINTNLLIQKNNKWYLKEATGFKTGHTDKSGYCLIATATYEGKEYLAVILGSTKEEIYNDAHKLFEYAFNKK
ncbi:D-alanyl-D-alanine carboxypeptidase [Clostridiaceae bacterium M8S5]|nr:D-alanyl-D-alanine carboxypeptidase [Clostridiaceae bacterium M8S5]